MQRGPGGDFIERAWVGKTVVCIASGPSVTREQIELVRQAREKDACRVAVVNDMYLLAPWADLCYFADRRWYDWHVAGVAKAWGWAKFSAEQVKKSWAEFKGQKVTIIHPNNATGPDIYAVKNYGPDSLSTKRDGVMTGSNSGYQVLNITVLAGGNPIALVGYDMRYAGGKSHSHNGHEMKMPESAYLGYAKRFCSMEKPLQALGVRVVNCSLDTAITAFPEEDLASFLAAAG